MGEDIIAVVIDGRRTYFYCTKQEGEDEICVVNRGGGQIFCCE